MLNNIFNKRKLFKVNSLLIGMHYPIKLLIICSAIFIATAQPAYCYIDPGSGSMIWQLIVSAFIGMSFYFRKTIAGVFNKIKKNNDSPEKNHEEK